MLQLRSQIKPSISVHSFPFIDSNHFACAFQTRKRHFNDSNYANNKQIVGVSNQNLHQLKKLYTINFTLFKTLNEIQNLDRKVVEKKNNNDA